VNAHLIERIGAAHKEMVAVLLAEMSPAGYWNGNLSSSALSTATAVVALATMDRHAHAAWVDAGLKWLAKNANQDGGWGDTVRSRSNLSTTALVWAAFGAANADASFPETVRSAAGFLTRCAGSMENLVPSIEARYGKDRTFSVPITMTLALSGRLGPDGWKRVRRLPFELAALPRGLFGALQLPVVSYALPALIAIGQVVHHHAPSWNPLRRLARRRTLDVLTTLQPENGGFLEATPLTSFVTMSLAAMDHRDHIVARRGAEFLRQSARPDGSWAIDTSLATWCTTLSINALRHEPEALSEEQRSVLLDWLLRQQHSGIHPYTGAAPGGWAWIDCPGGVPDADDTAAALVALSLLQHPGSTNQRFNNSTIQRFNDSTVQQFNNSTQPAAAAGIAWLLGLQNRDGGIPTFCRGWGTLEFDRSAPELTAHALRAWALTPPLDNPLADETRAATKRAIRFLANSQRGDGAWIPLWFGNEAAPNEENPVYGTSQVLLGTASLVNDATVAAFHRRGSAFLLANQNPDGGWGGALGAPSTIEETSVALEALAHAAEMEIEPSPGSATLTRGAEWLVGAIESGAWRTPAPIGLYFARLWYFERLYPVIFAAGALGRLKSQLR